MSDTTNSSARPARRRRRVVASQAAPAAAPSAPEQELVSGSLFDDAAAGGTTADEAAQELSADAVEVADEGAAAEAVENDDEAAESADSEDTSDSEQASAAEEEDSTAADESAASAEAEESSETDEPVMALPAASLLFQAPDPARARRRRRVTAAQAAPSAAPEVCTEQSASRASSQNSDEAAEARAEADNENVDAAESSSEVGAQERKPRRKSSRKSRSSKKKDSEQRSEEQATDLSEDLAELKNATRPDGKDSGAADAADADAEASTAASADEAEGEESGDSIARRRRRRGGRGRRSRGSKSDSARNDSADEADSVADAVAATDAEASDSADTATSEESGSSSRRRRRRRSRSRSDASRSSSREARDEVTALKGSTRLEAKRLRRREGRAAGRRRPIVTEAEFLARRESVDRQMIIREQDGLNQIAILEDGMLVEHYVARHTQASMVGNIYVGRVQNVLPSMEAAFVDLGQGRNAVLYAGEVNWDAAGMEGKPRRIEDALTPGDSVLVQVTKDPIGHKGARLTSQITLAGRYLVLVPGGSMTGISRKLPDTERARLKDILGRIVPDDAGVIVRTAAEGVSEEQLQADVERLVKQWERIDKKAQTILKGSGKAPQRLHGEPELAVRVVRDIFNEDFRTLIVQGPGAWETISEYVTELSPDLADRLEHWVKPEDVFSAHRIDEQLAKGFDRKVWLPSGGTLIIDRTEAMTVIDVNTGRFTGSGGTLEETITRNNLEAAEEIVRQLRLRDIGGMVVIDFVDMVLESNRDLVLRRLVECLGRDRTRHQVTEVTSLGLVQMTRKRVGQGLVEAFSTPCECCGGRGFIVHENPVEEKESAFRPPAKVKRDKATDEPARARGRSRKAPDADDMADDANRAAARDAFAQIAAAAEHAHHVAEETAASASSPASADSDAGEKPAEQADASAATETEPASDQAEPAQEGDSSSSEIGEANEG